MILKDINEVKKWLRRLSSVRRELELKIDFYAELASSYKKTGHHAEQVDYYYSQIKRLQAKADAHIADMETLFAKLDDSERLILTAKYIKMIRWDFIEYHVYYCRRHAIRIHNRALARLVGSTVSDL